MAQDLNTTIVEVIELADRVRGLLGGYRDLMAAVDGHNSVPLQVELSGCPLDFSTLWADRPEKEQTKRREEVLAPLNNLVVKELKLCLTKLASRAQEACTAIPDA